MKSCFPVHRWLSSPCASYGGRNKGVLWPLLVRTLIPFTRTLYSRPNHVLIWSECIPQYSCVEDLISNAKSDFRWGLWETFRPWELHLQKWINVIIKELDEGSSSLFALQPSPICGHNIPPHTRRYSKQALTRNQRLAFWPWSSKSLELWQINFCFLLITQSQVVCHSTTDGLRQLPKPHL